MHALPAWPDRTRSLAELEKKVSKYDAGSEIFEVKDKKY